MAKVMTARRADTCRAETCNAATREIKAGSQISYGGPGAVTHEGCPAMDAPRGRSRGRSGYTSRGYGRCEDAPCCGCCD
jgi:hypothetical protein